MFKSVCSDQEGDTLQSLVTKTDFMFVCQIKTMAWTFLRTSEISGMESKIFLLFQSGYSQTAHFDRCLTSGDTSLLRVVTKLKQKETVGEQQTCITKFLSFTQEERRNSSSSDYCI